MAEPTEYTLELLREGVDFTLYRGQQHGNPPSVLAKALAAERPSPQSVRLLENQYSLATELDEAWAAKPLALTRRQRRTVLILKHPGGEPLDRRGSKASTAIAGAMIDRKNSFGRLR